MRRDIRITRFYPHPPQRVWWALTNPAALAAWYMANDFKAEPGHKFTFRTDPAPGFDGILYGEVMVAEPPSRLRYTFIGGSMRHVTTVTFTLTPADGGTRLLLEHTGFTGLADVAFSFILGYGWRKFMRNLPGVLADVSRFPSS